jgi:hypothetical protein
MLRLVKRRGSTLYLVVGGTAVLFGAAAWVVDIGAGVKERSNMQAAADAGAIAATYDFKNGPSATSAAGANWVSKNGYKIPASAVRMWPLPNGKPAVTVKWTQPVKTTFGRIFGIPSFNVGIASSATLGGLVRIPPGAEPFGLPAFKDAYGRWFGLFDGKTNTYVQMLPGVRLQLKTGAGGGSDGNYLPLSLDGTGASIYSDTVVYGSNHAIEFGTVVGTETGNMAGPTRTGVGGRLARGATYADIFVPMIPRAEWENNNGRSTVTVIGFVMARLEPVIGTNVYADFINKVLPYPASATADSTPLASGPVLMMTP